MMRTTVCAAAAVLLLSVSNPAAAQSAKSLVGSWATVSSTGIDAGGNKSDTFGANPRGMLVFTADGRYSLIITSASLPKFASNARTKGTAAENQSIVAGSIAHFGKYTVDEKEKTLTYHVQSATFANWNGQAQKRPFTVKGDQLVYKVAAPSTGVGTSELVWKRLKPEL